MIEDADKKILEDLYQQFVAGRVTPAWLKDPDEIQRTLRELDIEQAARILDFIDKNCRSDDEVYQVFTIEVLIRTISTVCKSVEFSTEIADRSGFLQLITEHSQEVFKELTLARLPSNELELLRRLGICISEEELKRVILSAHEHREEIVTEIRRSGLNDTIKEIEDRLTRVEKALAGQPESARRPKRKWFTAIGLILTGSTTIIANVLSATTLVAAPLILSVGGGLGCMVGGAGALKGE
jgi:hypothetical protein